MLMTLWLAGLGEALKSTQHCAGHSRAHISVRVDRIWHHIFSNAIMGLSCDTTDTLVYAGSAYVHG